MKKVNDLDLLVMESVEALVREDIQQLQAYHVQPSSGMIKLDAMENPYGLPDTIRDLWVKKSAALATNRYPDSNASAIKRLLAERLALDSSCDILFGNGSDEIIQLLIMALAKDGAKVLAPEPSFVMYKMIAQYCRVDFIGVDLNEDFGLDIKLMLEMIRKEQPEIVFIAQPNNPTGNLFAHDDIVQIIKASKGLVVVDEAYTAFTDYDAIKLINEFANVVVMRTFSKVGLAGLRLGYLLGKSQWLNQLDKLRLPYNINVLTQALAELALENFELFEDQCKSIIEARNDLYKSLLGLEGLDVYQAETNFIVVRLLEKSAKDMAEKLKEGGVLIKVLDGSHPLLKQCLRLTVGSPEENEILFKQLALNLK